jgi:arginyl-tRNA synthetase
MPTITQILDQKFRQAIQAAFNLDADPIVVPAQNEKFGDYQANAAMSLAKTITEQTGQKTNPRQIAEKIQANLTPGTEITEVSIAGPGFINIKLNPQWLANMLQQAGASPTLGTEKTQSPQTVVVDYSGPNIAKELHVGHLRSTIIGDALVRVLDFQGHRVIKQNHIGDWGTQFGRVILAIWHLCMAKIRHNDPDYPGRMGQQLLNLKRIARQSAGNPADQTQQQRKQLVEQIATRQQQDIAADPDGVNIFEPFLETYDANLEELLPAYQFVSALEDTPEAQQIIIQSDRGTTRPLSTLSKLVTSDLQKGVAADPLNRQEEKAWRKVREATMDACQHIYDQLGVLLTREDEYGESRYNAMLPSVVEDLKKLGLAVESAGAIAVFIDGPDKDPLVIEKAGGEGYLYPTTDLAAIRYRVSSLRANRIIYLVDKRQADHFRKVFATAKKAGWVDGVSLEHAPFGTMKGEDGKDFKTRSGDTVKLKDLLDEAEERAKTLVTTKNPDLPEQQRDTIAHAVGIGAVKYSDLSKDRTSDYIFSWERILSFDGNTAPYLQNAHVRVHGIFRKARANGIDATIDYAALKLDSPYELSLAKHMLRLGETIDVVARELKPHHLCNYLYELATRYHAFFENCPVIQSEENIRKSRLALCDLVARYLAKGLDLLGIAHPQQM